METRMKSDRFSASCFAARSHACVACRVRWWLGAAGGDTTTPANAAKAIASGKSCGSSSGAAVSKEAEANWKEATRAFEAAEKAGWNADNCDVVSLDVRAMPTRSRGGSSPKPCTCRASRSTAAASATRRSSCTTQALEINSKLCGARVGIGIDALQERAARQQAYRLLRAAPCATTLAAPRATSTWP